MKDDGHHWTRNARAGEFRFSLSMDKENSPGYVSEKVLMAFSSGAIPVYGGSGAEIFALFNRD